MNYPIRTLAAVLFGTLIATTTLLPGQIPIPPGLKGKLTPEQIEKFRSQLSPEQRAKLREQFMNRAGQGGLEKKGGADNAVPGNPQSPAKTVAEKRDPDSKPLPRLQPLDSATAATEINRLLREELGFGSEPAPRVDEQLYLRRVSLDLIGTSPSPEELTAFVLDAATDKRAMIVDQLLSDPRYGANWAGYWRDVIMYRKSEDRAQIAARPLQEFLTKQLNDNASWAEIARQFITAQGVIIENGETAIFMAQMGDTEDVTAEMSRIFLGIQLQCAQCHDHPTDRWKREQFHELAAFFPRNTVRPGQMGNLLEFELVSVNNEFRFRGPDNGRPRGSTEHYMSDLKDPGAKGTRMEPVFFATGKQLPAGLDDVSRRTAAADLITGDEQPWFARSLVNRLWSELTGEGFYEPVDDIGPDREPTAPRTLDYLAAQFQANKHDLKWLMRTIMATEAYQRPAKSRRSPEEPPFTANVAQPLRADQLYNQLLKVLNIADQPAPEGQGRFAQLRDPRFQFNALFGFDPSLRRDEITASIPQTLAMMNGQLNGGISASRSGAVLTKLLRENPEDQDAILELYLRCLARVPSASEVAVCRDHIKQVGSRAVAYEDLFWSLLNSAEFHHRR